MKVIIGAISLFCLMLMAFGVYQYMEIQDLQQELMRQQGLTQSWQEKANAASAAQLALSDQAQACLDREIQRETENGIWLEILEQSQSRDMDDKEKGNVPDNKTRDALLDALDRPL